MNKTFSALKGLLWKLYTFSVNIVDLKILDFEKFKYLVLGCLNVGFSCIIYFVAYHFIVKKSNVDIADLLTISPHIFALMLSFSITFFTGFFMNYYLVFPGKEAQNRMIPKILKYFLANIGSILINYILLKVFVESLGWYPTPSQILSTIAVTVYSFIAQQKFTFAAHRQSVSKIEHKKCG
ncbi:GtrA family protein [Sphingobacterium paludis]|uniref:GtrA-like protein n=1 Tax=Sphingobacterium paludis TaxID=1476465 RepID=A0A4R7DB06_9SPHI|nr:GtrA family protein [Sphingobacterium paludis]TDS17451.1 GtrA-like protein [Sphingobacterium paludis]